MSKNAIVTTTFDGEVVGQEECAPDDYVIVLGPDIYLHHVQTYSNGTKILTIKKFDTEVEIIDE